LQQVLDRFAEVCIEPDGSLLHERGGFYGHRAAKWRM
jgi:hypothetical protein